MDKQQKLIYILVIVFLSIFLWKTEVENKKLKENIDSLEIQNVYLEDKASGLEDALSEANRSIEDVNSSIEDAKYNVWDSYNDMGYALDSLETVDTVEAP